MAAIKPDADTGSQWGKAQTQAFINQYWSGLSEYAGDPEIWHIMEMAGQHKWGDQMVTNLLKNTQLFKDLAAQEPSAGGGGGGGGGYGGRRGGGGGGGGGGGSPEDLANQLASIKAELMDKASTYGIPMTDDQATWIAQYGIDHAFSETQFNDSIVDLVKTVREGGGNIAETGTINVDKNQLRKMARDYLVGVSDSTVDEYAVKIAQGALTIDGVRAVFMTQAKARRPYLAALIDGGITPGDYFAPTRDVIARTLEMPTEMIDLMDDQWSKLVEIPDEKTGIRGATLSEAAKAARSDSRWKDTQNAKDTAAQWADALPKIFGQN